MKKILDYFFIVIVAVIILVCIFSIRKKEENYINNELTINESEDLLYSNDVLPIGTVVLLKGGSKKIMINGHLQVKVSDKEVVYDYSGVDYPEGQLNTETSYLFNKSIIERILYLGYNSDEQSQLQKKINEIKKKQNKN